MQKKTQGKAVRTAKKNLSDPAVSSGTSYSVKKRETLKKPRETYIYLSKKRTGVYHAIAQKNITIYDEERNERREIRYCPGENSIYVDEQSPIAKRSQIVFREGMLAVRRENPSLIKYLNAHPANIANGGSVFYLKDEAKTAVQEVENEFAVHEAVGLVRDKTIDELLPVAMYLGLNTNDETMTIKRELLKTAKSNPTGFIKMFDNPTVKTRSAIMQAVEFQILNNSSDGMRWFDSGGLIVSTPIGQDTLDVMTRFCLTEKGSEVFGEITRRLDSIA